jgi:hypothetical protein
MRTINVPVTAGLPAFSWRKSSLSAANGNCVEVAQFPGRRIAVRDSKDPAAGPVILSAGDWRRFIDDLKG